ncbi:MAG: sulfotransferase, partial [Lacipirellulaceae bacterium]
MHPEFVVIGAQKAGSTYVLRCLEEHPEIFMPPYEVAFFEGELYSPERMDAFESHFQAAQAGQLVGFKRPNLLGLPECPERLAKHLPEAKLIAVLRNPVARAVSAYFHYMKTGFLPIVPLEVGMPKILDGQYTEYPRASEVLTFGLYGEHLANYLKFFPEEQLRVVTLENIKQAGQQTIEELYDFLGVERSFQPSSGGSRPMAASYSLTRLRLWNGIDRLLRKAKHGGK